MCTDEGNVSVKAATTLKCRYAVGAQLIDTLQSRDAFPNIGN
jgi:hypothetical protein